MEKLGEERSERIHRFMVTQARDLGVLNPNAAPQVACYFALRDVADELRALREALAPAQVKDAPECPDPEAKVDGDPKPPEGTTATSLARS